MDRRTLLTKLLGAVGAGVALLPTSLFGDRTNGNLVPSPCKLPKGGPRAGYFPNVVLINQDYYRARFYDDLVMGKLVILNSFATTNRSPMQPQIMANLVELQKLLGNRVGRDVFMYSISFDPEHDTPEVLHAYAERLGVGPGWSLLTGRLADVKLILSRLWLGAMMMGGHFGALRLGNEPLDRWLQMPGVFKPRMIADRLSLLESRPEREDLKDFVFAGPTRAERWKLTHLTRTVNGAPEPIWRDGKIVGAGGTR